ncbi:MAG: acyltransferase [bacterium]
MNFRRFKQVLVYGWKHSLVAQQNTGGARLTIFIDIIRCFYKYKMWSNQYLKEKFYSLSKEERETIGAKYYVAGKERDAWQEDFQENNKFLHKYSSTKYEIGRNKEKKIKAYTKRYNAGKNLMVSYDVQLSRRHYLPGTITIGDNVLLSKHVFIDYSGGVIVKDGASIGNGVIILTHDHSTFMEDNKAPKGTNTTYATKLIIEERAIISSRAIILPSCNYIGKNSRIGAGVVVKNDVPDNTLVATKPAKMVAF